jgi:hypothetical protein
VRRIAVTAPRGKLGYGRCTLLLLALLAFHPGDLAAQILQGRGILIGMVIDDTANAPVAGAQVELLDAMRRRLAISLTDPAGSFRFSGVPGGAFMLRVSRIGFTTASTPYWNLAGGEHLHVEVRMTVDAVLLAPLAIVARRHPRASPVLEGFRQRAASGSGHYITRAQIEERRPAAVSDLLATLPGVRVERNAAGGGRRIHMGRGTQTRDCPAQIFVDGFLMNRRDAIGGLDFGFTLDDVVSPAAVEGIEVYQGLAGIPAEFLNADARCGVVVIWTRRGVE